MINFSISTTFSRGQFRELILTAPGVRLGTGYIPTYYPGILPSTVKAWTEVRYQKHSRVLQAGHKPVTMVG